MAQAAGVDAETRRSGDTLEVRLKTPAIVFPFDWFPGQTLDWKMGLARELRRGGHEVRVLGPCDGPPPESFVTPLGDSLPTAANGSIAQASRISS